MTSDSETIQTNVRLSIAGRNLLEGLAGMLGISHKDVIEIALRRFAREEGLWSPPSISEARKGSQRGGRI